MHICDNAKKHALHLDFQVYGDVQKRSTCHNVFQFTISFISSFLLSPLHNDDNGYVPPVPSLFTCFLWPHLRLRATLALTPWLPCHQHLPCCKAASQTNSPDQTFCKVQCTSYTLFKRLCLLFQLFLIPLPLHTFRKSHESLFQTPSTIPLQKQLFTESQAYYYVFAAWAPLLAPLLFSATRKNIFPPTKVHLGFAHEHFGLS